MGLFPQLDGYKWQNIRVAKWLLKLKGKNKNEQIRTNTRRN
jgi:hypothetical protein